MTKELAQETARKARTIGYLAEVVQHGGGYSVRIIRKHVSGYQVMRLEKAADIPPELAKVH